MTIKIPVDIRSRYDGFLILIDAFFQAHRVTNSTIYIDFQDVNFFDANLCALLGAYIEIFKKANNSVKIINLKNSINIIFRKNEFMNEFNEKAIEDIHSTSIKYKKFQPLDENEFKFYIKNELLGKNDFPSHSIILGQKIIENIFELYENARTHGRCEYIHTCGQYFPKHESKPLRFTIVDRGKNIKENVNDYLADKGGLPLSGSDAIEWAVKKGNTTKSGTIPGGLGLDVIFQFIKLNKGKIQIISSDGYWEYKNDYIDRRKLSGTFDGTIANLEFNLNDINHYSMSDELENDDFENLF